VRIGGTIGKAYKVHSTTRRQRPENGSEGGLNGTVHGLFCWVLSAASSAHLTFFAKERNRQCRLTRCREVNHYLLVSIWVLFSPQYQK
jgi:hypothetical protein